VLYDETLKGAKKIRVTVLCERLTVC
jgi:hypothetical protein